MNNEKICKILFPSVGGGVPVVLAPMAGVADRAMRLLCAKYGADLVTSEMISAKAVHFGDKKTGELAEITPGERPMTIQIFGSEPEIMAESALSVFERYSPDIIDINMGCPVRKVTGNGEGSALMRDPVKAGRIVRAVSDALPCPVTAKIRAGWDADTRNACEVARVLEANGAAAVCVHGRTRAQMYAPPVDLDIIRDVKSAVGIPVFGNGGIETPADALAMLEYTGCDGIAVARGACGAPWIFEGIKAALAGREWQPPRESERLRVAMRHLEMLLRFKGEYTGLREARKHIGWYMHGLRGAAAARARINITESPDEVRCILGDMIKEYE